MAIYVWHGASGGEGTFSEQDLITSFEHLSFGFRINVGGFAGATEELVMRYNRAISDVGSVRIDYNWIAYTGHKRESDWGFLIRR